MACYMRVDIFLLFSTRKEHNNFKISFYGRMCWWVSAIRAWIMIQSFNSPTEGMICSDISNHVCIRISYRPKSFKISDISKNADILQPLIIIIIFLCSWDKMTDCKSTATMLTILKTDHRRYFYTQNASSWYFWIDGWKQWEAGDLGNKCFYTLCHFTD